jgi:hypothetical protein
LRPAGGQPSPRDHCLTLAFSCRSSIAATASRWSKALRAAASSAC